MMFFMISSGHRGRYDWGTALVVSTHRIWANTDVECFYSTRFISIKTNRYGHDAYFDCILYIYIDIVYLYCLYCLSVDS